MGKFISRREFLKGTAAGALSIAAASVLGVNTAMEASAGEAAKYIPGTYTATAQGLESDVVVKMTFDESSILEVAIDVSGETPGIGAEVGDTLAEAILAGQSADVDVVAGASVTSNAVKKAAADCISQALGAAPAGAEENANAAASDDDWLGQAPEISDADVEEEITTDVLVIGCGVLVSLLSALRRKKAQKSSRRTKHPGHSAVPVNMQSSMVMSNINGDAIPGRVKKLTR